jgi:hypothetical protein
VSKIPLHRTIAGVPPPDGDGPHIVARIEHADHGFDVLHVRGEALGLLAVREDAASQLGMKPNQGG